MKATHAIGVAAALLMLASAAAAEVRTQEIEYRQGDTVLQGFIAWNDALPGKRPGILVVHEWWGHNDHVRGAARRLAEAGYVGFALDLYGKGKLATTPPEAQAMMTEALKEPAVIAARFDAALTRLKQDPHVDPDRISAIGYCFGGGVVLNMARAGVPLDTVTSFHGSLGTRTPAEKGKIKPRLLVLTGDADPLVPPAQVDAFKQEMTAADVKYEVVLYPGAKHAFTNPDADRHGVPALGYNAAADRESWAAMLALLKQVYG